MSQPLDQVYQNPVMTSQPGPPRSNGSFGPVFIVLAVIVVVSAAACVVGRICSKRHDRAREGPHKPHKQTSQSQGLGPKEWESTQKPTRDGDIEFGFDKKSSKGAKVGGEKTQPSHYNVNPTSYNANPTAYNARPTSYNANPTAYSARPTSYNANPTAYNARPTSYNANPTPYNGANRPEQARYADNM